MVTYQGLWVLVGAAALAAGCATSEQWATWRQHPTHFASGDHHRFSRVNRDTFAPRVTVADRTAARQESWWGANVPTALPASIAGDWAGYWEAPGVLGRRQGHASIRLVQDGIEAEGRLVLGDTGATDMPLEARLAGMTGIPVVVRINGPRVSLRHARDPSLFTARLTLTDSTLAGRVDSDGGPIFLVLTR